MVGVEMHQLIHVYGPDGKKAKTTPLAGPVPYESASAALEHCIADAMDKGADFREKNGAVIIRSAGPFPGFEMVTETWFTEVRC
jgi:hypothetical protein